MLTKRKRWWARLWRWALAYFHLNLKVVCEESASMGVADYHDYTDTEDGQPCHMTTLRCKRCGKHFII